MEMEEGGAKGEVGRKGLQQTGRRGRKEEAWRPRQKKGGAPVHKQHGGGRRPMCKKEASGEMKQRDGTYY